MATITLLYVPTVFPAVNTPVVGLIVPAVAFVTDQVTPTALAVPPAPLLAVAMNPEYEAPLTTLGIEGLIEMDAGATTVTDALPVVAPEVAVMTLL